MAWLSLERTLVLDGVSEIPTLKELITIKNVINITMMPKKTYLFPFEALVSSGEKLILSFFLYDTLSCNDLQLLKGSLLKCGIYVCINQIDENESSTSITISSALIYPTCVLAVLFASALLNVCSSHP